MKYLAVLLAILSAGSAWGADMKRYVPKSVTIDFRYTGPNGSLEKQSTTIETTEPQIKWFYFEDKNRADRVGISPYTATQQIYNGPGGTFDIRGQTGQMTFFNDNYSASTYLHAEYGNNASTPIFSGEKQYAYLPTSNSTDNQKIRVNCGVPENISGPTNAPYIFLTTTLQMEQDGVGAVYVPEITATCRWYLTEVIDLSISLEKNVMEISGIVGNNKTYKNNVHVTGNSGPVTITIVNPEKTDISVSFSDSNDSVLTTTATPATSGATVPFYVVPKNTQAGSRSYNVNFTATYV
ncbi:TPA: hypothetical protein ACJFS2_004116 [Escherichia coli]